MIRHLLVFYGLFLSICCFAGNIEDGEEINETCAGCHGEYAQGGSDGEYPRLASLPEQYLVAQLKSFQGHHRLNIPMDPYTKRRELSVVDMEDVAAFLFQIKLYNKLPPIKEEDFDAYARLEMTRRLSNIAKIDGDYQQGRKIYKQECASCHGKNGLGKKEVPMLAGQYTKYLKKQIDKYLKGSRIHDDEPADESFFKDFTAEEVENILAYLTILDD